MQRHLINFAFGLVIFAIWFLPLNLVDTLKYSDFPMYYVAAHQIADGRAADIYLLDKQEQVSRRYFSEGQALTFDPPYTLVALAPLSLLSPSAARLTFSFILAALLSASAVTFSNAIGLSNRMTLVLIASMAVSGPVVEVLKVAKPIPIYLLGLSIALYFLHKRKESPAGVAAALCLMKPHELLPWLAVPGGGLKLRFLLPCALAGLAIIGVSFVVFGTQGYQNWFQLLPYVNAHPEIPAVSSMPTLRGQLMRFSLSATTAGQISTAVYAAMLVSLGIVGWLRRHQEHWWIEGTMLASTVGCVFCPYMHLYDFIITVPAICYLLQILFLQKRRYLLAVAFACIALFMEPFYGWIHYDYLIGGNNILNIHFLAFVVLFFVTVAALRNPGLEVAPAKGECAV